jgi:antitoxin PrlF
MKAEEIEVPSATVTSKGQITIPIEVRTALGVDAGDKIDFIELEEGQYAIRPRTGSIMDMKGCFPKLGHSPTIEEMDKSILDSVGENFRSGLRDPASGSEKSS